MISIVDYGSGNIQAVTNIYKRLNIKSNVVSTVKQLKNAQKIILPGVGAFDESINQLNKSGLRETLDNMVLDEYIPVLGICVGMQIMARDSDEGKLPGLGWFSAKVKIFDTENIVNKPKIPHMGWNTIKPLKNSNIFRNIDSELGFYFLHSYYFECENKTDILSSTEYGDTFSSSINKDHIYGFQFHPEKSHINGINLFKNFAEII